MNLTTTAPGPDAAETNAGRADAGHRALDAFAERQLRSRVHITEALEDLLANLRHLADRHGIDWDDLLVYVDRTHSDEIAQELELAEGTHA
jgi:hypothetical protein